MIRLNIRMIRAAGLAAMATMIAVPPAKAQSTCGWDLAPPPHKLPIDVESIIALLPPGFKNADDNIAKLEKWYRACDASAASEAIFEFNRAHQRDKSNQAIGALLGTALVHGPEVQIANVKGITNRPVFQLSNAERDGARLLAHAAETDPHLDVAATELAMVALQSRHTPTVTIALEALKVVADRTRNGKYEWLAAEVSNIARDYPAAKEHALKALQYGDSSGLHPLAVANILTGEGRTGAKQYLDGLRYAPAIPLYYDDLSYLLLASDTLEWNQLADSARGQWIHDQWTWRSATSSVDLAERLTTHFTRLAFAIDHYPRTAFRTPPPQNAVTFDLRTRRMTVDDEGLIYIRHGAPTDIVHMPDPMHSLEPTRMAWFYPGLEDGHATFEFTRDNCYASMAVPDKPVLDRTSRNGVRRVPNQPAPKCTTVGDYFLVSPIDCMAVPKPLADNTYMEYGSAIGARNPALGMVYLRCYSEIVANSNAGDIDARNAENKIKGIIRGMAALRTESAAPPFKQPLDVVLNTYAMRDDGETRLYGFASVGGKEITPQAGTLNYAMRILLSVENDEKKSVTRSDSTLTFHTAAPLSAGQRVNAAVWAIAAPQPDATVRLAVRNPNDSTEGQIVTTKRAIPQLAVDGLTMSDIVISELRNGSWLRGDIRLAPVPGNAIAQGAPFRLYHEVYGAQTGDSLQIAITIAPSNSTSVIDRIKSLIDRNQAQTISFSERATADPSGTFRIVKEITPNLEPGRYVLSVRVTDGRLGAATEAHAEMVVMKD